MNGLIRIIRETLEAGRYERPHGLALEALLDLEEKLGEVSTDDALARENSNLRKAIHAALMTKYEPGLPPWWAPLEAVLGINPGSINPGPPKIGDHSHERLQVRTEAGHHRL